ncbi:MAG: PAS domain S-box protein [Thermoplasmatota archaeon]
MVKKLEQILIEFIDNLSDLFILGDTTNWTIVHLNESMAKSIGKTKKELIGQRLLDVIPHNVTLSRIEYAKKAISTKKPVFFIDQRDDRWFENAFYPIIDSQKKVFIIGFIRDITSKIKAEKEKIESKEKFKNLAEQSPNMIYINQGGSVVFVNKACEKVLGYSKKEFYSPDFNFLDLVSPEYKEVVKTNFKKHMEGKDILPTYYKLITKNGKTIDTIHNTKLIQFNGKQAILGIVTDISKFKKVEDELRQTKENLQNVIDSTGDFIFAVDNELKILTWNKIAEIVTGYKKNEVIGKFLESLHLFDDISKISFNLENVKNNNKNNNKIEIIIKTKNGSKRVLYLYSSYLKDENGENKGVLFIGKDVTKEDQFHGRLIPGNSYIITDKTNNSALHLFEHLIVSGYNGLLITRDNPDNIQKITYNLNNIEVVTLSQEKIIGSENVVNTDELIKKINNFTIKNSNPLILIDRIDYLITSFSFDSVIKALYRIIDIISMKKGILLVRINPSVLNANQLAFFEEELNPVPSQKIDTIDLLDQCTSFF